MKVDGGMGRIDCSFGRLLCHSSAGAQKFGSPLASAKFVAVALLACGRPHRCFLVVSS